MSAARNRGVRTGEAALLAFLDPCDAWDRDHLSRHVAAFDVDARLGVSFSAAVMLDEAGQPTGERSQVRVGDLSVSDVLASNAVPAFSALVVHRDVFAALGSFRSEDAAAEVQALLLRAIAAGWVVSGIGSNSVRCRAGDRGNPQSTGSRLIGWAAFLQHVRNGSLRPSGQTAAVARLTRCPVGSGRRASSGYMSWLPDRLAHRNPGADPAGVAGVPGHAAIKDVLSKRPGGETSR